MLRRVAVDTCSIGVGSSGIGDSSHRQKRVSSFSSQLLQAPSTASANTPLVGSEMRIGGAGSVAYRSSKSVWVRFECS